jgi:dihydrofolate reductase
MAKLISFNFVSLNGFYKGPDGDISWHKNINDPEQNEYAEKGAQSGSTLLFGRVTYDMMASFWPTPQATAFNAKVAKGMNESKKIVFSKTMKKADWNNTTVVNGNIIEEVKKLKANSGSFLTILGSGSIITQLADAGLIDEYQFMVDPLAIGDGTPMFKGIKQKLGLKLVNNKIFKSGVIFLSYEPAQ